MNFLGGGRKNEAGCRNNEIRRPGRGGVEMDVIGASGVRALGLGLFFEGG